VRAGYSPATLNYTVFERASQHLTQDKLEEVIDGHLGQCSLAYLPAPSLRGLNGER